MLDRLKEAIKGTNFWLAVLLFLGSWVALTEDAAGAIIVAVTAVVAAVGAVRLWIKNDFKWVGSKNLNREANMWNYLGQIVIALFPLAGDLTPALADLVEALITKQWNLVISRVITLITVIIYLIRQSKNDETPKNSTGTVADVATAVL